METSYGVSRSAGVTIMFRVYPDWRESLRDWLVRQLGTLQVDELHKKICADIDQAIISEKQRPISACRLVLYMDPQPRYELRFSSSNYQDVSSRVERPEGDSSPLLLALTAAGVVLLGLMLAQRR